MRKFVFIVYVFLGLLLPDICPAVTGDEINFTRISIDQGLSQSTVFSIAQDGHGNMWFGTYDGVNKYDGYEFTVYQHRIGDTTSISDDIVRDLCCDGRGHIWIGTVSGLSCYDETRDSFRNFSPGPDKVPVSALLPVGENILLMSADGKLVAFDTAQYTFLDDFLPGDTGLVEVTALEKDDDNNVYIGTEAGSVYLLDPDLKTVGKIDYCGDGVRVQTILCENDDILWIGTEGAGLFCLDLKTSECVQYNYRNSGLGSNYIRSLETDMEGNLWIGTFSNLFILDRKTGNFTLCASSPVDPQSLSQQSVRSICRDNQGGMWLGTYFGGINYWHPLKMKFRNIRTNPYANSLSGKIVSCIVEDEDGTLWIGTNEGGLNHYDPETKKFEHYLKGSRHDGIESNDIKAIYVDSERNRVYIGAHAGGLITLDRATGRLRRSRPAGGNAGSSDVYAILPRTSSTLWIGTLNGLYVFDKDSDTFLYDRQNLSGTPVLTMQILSMFKDSGQRLWIGGDDLLSVYDVSEGKVGRCLSAGMNLPDVRSVQDFHESSDGKIWIATRSGLYCYSDYTLIHLTTADGLPNNVIYGIEEDNRGNLWLSSNKGLCCLDPESLSMKNYSSQDGLQSDQFNMYSHCRTKSGRMYFGGIDGITTFVPEALQVNTFSPKPIITQLSLFNKVVRPGDGTGILSDNISNTDHITLNYSQRSISLAFVVPNFISGQHNSFAYRLEGYDDEWYYPENGIRSVSYSNLPAGKYVFLVKSANSDGIWCEEPVRLSISVNPVWYNTWWAISLFIFLAAGISVFFARFFWERKAMAAKMEMEKKEQQAKDEVNQMKMRFFINISHELRTPLTLIVAPLQEMIMKTSDKWMKTQLRFIERNTNRLLHLVNQLMDYRRAEQGVFKLKVSKEDVFGLVRENFSFYEKLAQHKKLAYTFISDLDGKTFLADRKYLDLIVNNLISNAFKYTESGSVTVRLYVRDNNLVLQVSDTGIGIPVDKQAKIFERFYQVGGNRVGSGIGLSLVQRLAELHHGSVEVESREGEGSTFTVLIPQDVSLYSEEEMLPEGESRQNVQAYSTSPHEMYYIDTEKYNNEEEEVTSDKKKGTLLIVEDNDEIRSYLKSSLSGMFDVHSAENGEQALDFLMENQETDLVITDVMMPVMDGIKLCRAIKQNIRTSHIPVIMLSAKTDPDDQLEGYHTGADDYIAKPFALNVLVAKINNIIRTRKRIREHYAGTLEVEPEAMTFSQVDEDMLNKAIEIIRKNMDNESFSTEEFAREMNMSRSSLHLKMKAVTGESALDFIRKIRFNEACRLLKEGRYTIAEISYKVGFSSPSYFSTSFKKYVGCLPTEYIRNNG